MPLIVTYLALNVPALWLLFCVPGSASSVHLPPLPSPPPPSPQELALCAPAQPQLQQPLCHPCAPTPPLSPQEPALCAPAQPQLQQPPGLRAKPHCASAVHGRRGPQPGLAGQWLGLGQVGGVSLVGPSCPRSPRSSLVSPAAANSPRMPSHLWSTTTSRWHGGRGTDGRGSRFWEHWWGTQQWGLQPWGGHTAEGMGQAQGIPAPSRTPVWPCQIP